jgi:hypothetical protein
VGGNVTVDSETFLVIDFINLKIKSTQSFKDVHKNRVCVHMFIEASACTYINMYYVSKKVDVNWAEQTLRSYPKGTRGDA